MIFIRSSIVVTMTFPTIVPIQCCKGLFASEFGLAFEVLGLGSGSFAAGARRHSAPLEQALRGSLPTRPARPLVQRASAVWKLSHPVSPSTLAYAAPAEGTRCDTSMQRCRKSSRLPQVAAELIGYTVWRERSSLPNSAAVAVWALATSESTRMNET